MRLIGVLFWAIALLVPRLHGAEVIIATNANWKYLDNGSDQGTAWIATNFNDSAWTNGPAEFGYGDGFEATTNSFGPDPQNKFVTTYFRHTVVVPNPSIYTNLTLRVLRDDGAVVYINGSEVWRLSITNSTVSFTNLASTQAEYGYESTNLLVSVLQPGTNVVAVEVHQGSLSSSDMSFALELTGDRDSANVAPSVSITSPNNNQSFTAPANIGIVASASDSDGTIALVEFFQNGTKLGEDSTAPYSNNWANVFAGSYQLRAVATDNLGARATSAVVNVNVTGNAAPTASITAPANNAVFTAPTNVTITASASDPNGNLDRVEFYEGSTLLGADSSTPYGITWTNPAIGSYTLRAVAIDTGPGPARGTSAPVSVSIASTAPTNLIVRGADWKYLDDGSDQSTAWKERIFDDSSWASGPAQLGYGDGDEATILGCTDVCRPCPTCPANVPGKFATTYFRHTFPVADPNAYVTLALSILRDDGAIVYLNGQEVFRSNMPGDPITYQTYTGVSTTTETQFFSTNPPASLLVAGANVVAVEIHQHNDTSSDLSFDFELIGRTSNERPVVNITSPTHNSTYTEPATITFGVAASDADGTIALVEFFQNGNKLGEDSAAPYSFVWTDVPVGTYNLTAVVTDNLGASTTSGTVTVFVTPAVPPTIANVSPAAGNVSSLSQITVTFSENVSAVTASDLLINGVPAASVSGENSVYTFSFAQPRDGVVRISWDGGHGIADFENPPQRFDHYSAGANWQYTLTDTVAPIIVQRQPVAGAVVSELTKVSVTFSEAVWGVDQTDLLINGAALATQVSGSGVGPYTFEFAQAFSGMVTFNWAAGHNIRDFASTPNLFSGGSWSYTLDATAVYEGKVVVNEIMYHPASERISEEYIEILNTGASPVNLTGWRITRGVDFAFPSMTLPAGGYLVIAADLAAFSAKYPGVANVVGGWTGRLSNTREDIELEDAAGIRVDIVDYADEGDFAVHRLTGGIGWEWFAEHDGLGKSLELRNAALENNSGQNWAPSIPAEGTPGVANSMRTNNVAPLILGTSHFPVIPNSTNSITISATIIDEQAGATVTLRHRDAAAGGAFSTTAMFDDGAHNDGVAGDRVFGAVLSPMANGIITEFYIEASDSGGRTRTWPTPDPGGVQDANAFFQVDDEVYTGNHSIYRLIMRPADRDGFINQRDRIRRNITFISVEGTDVEVRYNCDGRRRGASSFNATPPTMKFTFPSDRAWNDKTSINLNSINTWAQVVGAAVSVKAGLPAARARGVQLRFNGVNESAGGSQMFGLYAHVEVLNDEWANDFFPNDGDGNAYSKRRGCCPVDGVGFEYWGSTPNDYIRQAYDKESNTSENDWSDLMNLLRAVDPDTTPDSDYVAAMRRNANVELWMRYFAVLFLMNSTETALNNGADDDYNMYRGVVDPRFMILPHDFDQIFGSQGTLPNDIFVGARIPNISRFLHHPEFEPLFYEEFRRLLGGIFSTNQLFPLFDQILGDWAPAGTIQMMRDATVAKINYVSSILPPPPVVIQATITGEPPAVTYLRNATLTVGGTDITHYRFRTNNGAYSSERTVATPISLSALADGSYTVYVIGRNAAGTYQSQSAATVSKTWTVIGSLANVVINEVLAQNNSLTLSNGQDLIELYNPRNSSVDLSGLRLTDDPSDPGKFTFAPGTSLGAGAYRVLSENTLNFALNLNGEGVYLFDRVSNGGALIDSVEFGHQLPDLSIGRLANGQWALTTPTFGAANVAVPTGDIYNLRVNEWLADGVFPFTEDFIEIYNPNSSPVDLGGLYLTDNPIGEPARHQIGPLHFVDGFAYTSFIADGDPDAGPNHVDFGLALERGEIGLFAPDLTPIDCITYTQQQLGRSQGRSPNGSSTIRFFDTPTPGAGNPGSIDPDPPIVINLIPINDTFLWRYEESGTNLQTAWRAPGYNDSSWPQGPALLGQARNGCSPCPSPMRTPLTISNTKTTFYFRARFNLASNVNLSSLEMRHTIDDGAVFYLNGEEAGRYNMPGGTITVTNLASQNVLDATPQGPFALPLTNVFAGTNVLAVEVHQASPSSQDIVFGLELNGIIVTNNPAAAGVVINEVLANSQTLTNQFLGETNASEADWIELYNPSNGGVDLSNMSLTDDVSIPRRWVFPPGSVIPALGYFQVRADSSAPSSPTNTGFGLSQNGESVYLFNRPADGGALLDSISFGLQAADFSIGRFPNGSSNWVICLPTPRASNLRVTSLGDITRLKVNEWWATGNDWFEIYNPNAQPVDLSGIFLTDDPSTPATRTNKYQAPRLSFIGVGAFAYQRFEADNNRAAGPEHVGFQLGASGDTLAIYRDAVTAIDVTNFLGQVAGVSEGRLPDGANNISKFTNSASPGDANYVLLNNVVINEVLTHTPTNTAFEDAIELRNLTGSQVDISGWYLSDSKNNLKKYRIRISPATRIPANGFMVFYENQFNALPGDPTSFSLNASGGDEVYLSQATLAGELTGHRAVASFGPAEATVSFGRYQTSREVHFTALSRRTFGVDNPGDIGEFRTGTGLPNALPLVGPVVISEFMYHPPDDNFLHEYVELRNISPNPVPLYHTNYTTNTWRLRRGVDYDFPPNITLPVGAVILVVSFDPFTDSGSLSSFRTRYSLSTAATTPGVTIFGPYSGRLDNSGEAIEIRKPDAPLLPPDPDAGMVPYITVDRVDYTDRTPPWPFGADGAGDSLQRINLDEYANDPINWRADPPTPGPGATDTDGDGLDDNWERTYFGNLSQNASGDPDADGMNNFNEFRAGTNPADGSSSLRLSIVSMSPVTLRFFSVADKTYTIEYQNALSTGPWTVLTNLSAQGTSSFRQVTNPGAPGMRFYRIRTP